MLPFIIINMIFTQFRLKVIVHCYSVELTPVVSRIDTCISYRYTLIKIII